MLSGGEKAYCTALTALKHRDYKVALEQFEKAAPFFEGDKEFNLCFETTRLLVAVRDEMARLKQDDKLDVEEVFSNG